MSQVFFQKLLGLFLGFTIFLMAILATSEILIFYVITKNTLFYYGYLATAVLIIYIGLRFYRDFLDVQAHVYLLIPRLTTPVNVDSPEPLNIEDKSLPPQVCAYYRNGASFIDIEQSMGMKHPNQARRELIKGLDILLKAYKEKSG